MKLQLLGPLVFLISGWACCHLVPGLRDTSRVARLGYSYLLGMAYVSGMLYLLSHVAGIRLGAVSVFIVSIVPVIAAVAVHLRETSRRRPESQMTGRAAGSAIAALAISGVLLSWITVGVMAEAVTNPVRDYDGRMTWSAQARFVHAAGTVDAEVLRENRWFVTHPRYPLLLPLAQVAALEATSEPVGRRMPRSLYALFLPAFLLVVHDAVRRLTRPLPAALTLFVGCTIPMLAFGPQGGAVSAFSDLPLAAFLCGAIALALRREGPGTDLAAGALFAACVLTKQEGMFLALVGLIAVILQRGPRRGRTGYATEVSALVLPVVTAVVLLLSWQSGISDRHDEQYLSQWAQTDPRVAVARLVAVAPQLVTELLATEVWGLFWPLLTLATILGWRIFRGRTPWLLLAAAATPALGGLAVYGAHPDASALIEVTWNRLMLQATGPLLILLGLCIGDVFEGDQPEAEAGRGTSDAKIGDGQIRRHGPQQENSLLYHLDRLPEREPMPGFRGRFVHTETSTMAYWQIDEGAELPEHDHPHEQIVNQLEGELELVVDGEPHRLGPGDVLVIPGGVRHSGRALTDCRVLDVFVPVREDYR